MEGFGVHFPLPTFPQPPTLSFQDQIALESLRAAERSANAAWWTFGVTLLTFGVAILAARYSKRALETWRSQVTGEKEFSALIESVQAVRDMGASTYNMRLRNRVGHYGDLGPMEASQAFRKQLEDSYRQLLRATTGLDAVWGEEFIALREAVHDEVRRLSLASNMVYERPANSIPIEQQYHLLRDYAPRWVTNPLSTLGLSPAEREMPEPETVGEQAEAIEREIAASQKKFTDLEAWLAGKLSYYAPSGKR